MTKRPDGSLLTGRGKGLRPWLAVLLFLGSGAAFATTTINHQFAPATISQGDVSAYRITIANDATVPLTAAAVTSLLAPNIRIAEPLAINNTCGFTVDPSVAAGGSSVILTGGTIPAAAGTTHGQCYLEVNVTSVVAGNHIITIPANTDPGPTTAGYSALQDGVPVSNDTPANATLLVAPLLAPTGSKTFSPDPAVVGNPVTLRIVLTNPNPGSTMPLTSFADDLPDGMVVAPVPNAAVACTGAGATNGTVTAGAGEGSVTLAGGTIGNGGSCTVTVDVVVPSIEGTNAALTNAVPAGAIGNERGLESPAFSGSLTVNAPIGVTKDFNPDVIPVGQPSRMTIVIANRSATSDLVIQDFLDQFPVGMTLSGNGNGTVSCTPDGNGVTTNGTLTLDTDSLGLAGAVAGRNGSCTIGVDVTAPGEAALINTIEANAVQNPGGIGSPAASAALYAYAALQVEKSVRPEVDGTGYVAPGQWAEFAVRIRNYSGAPVTNASITDNLPVAAGYQMVLDGSGGIPVSDSCGFSFPAGAGQNADGEPRLAGTSGTIPANAGTAPGSCELVFRARLPAEAPAGVTFTNSLPAGAVTGSGNGPGGDVGNTNEAASNLVSVDAVFLTKSFSPEDIAQGQASVLTLGVRNRTVNTLTGIDLTDLLPLGLTLAANPDPSSDCGGSLATFPGSNQLVLTGGSVAARGAESVDVACTIRVRVTGSAIGTYTNTIDPGDFDSSGGTIPGPVSANLRITAGLTATKGFSPAAVAAGGRSRVTIRILSQSPGALTNVSLNDTGFAPGLTVANPANAATSCGGAPVITANPGASFVRLDGVSLPAGASCDLSFDVAATGEGPWANLIPAGAITSAEGPYNDSAVTATLGVQTAELRINKAFDPVIVTGNQPSRLSIDVLNNSGVAIEGVAFTDVFPDGIQVFPVPDVGTNCPGGTAVAEPGGGSVSLVGATLPPSSICQVYVTVTSVRFLNLTNTIPAGAISSTGGFTNAEATTATLSTLQGLGVSKGFEPAYVAPGQISRLRIRLVNTFDPNAVDPLVLTGVTFTDALPEGLLFAANPNGTTTCTAGTIAVNNDARLLTLTGATLAPGGSCEIAVDVLAPQVGVYENLILAGTVQTNEGVTNGNNAEAELGVGDTPGVSKSFDPPQVNLGGSTSLIVTITNPTGVDLTGVSLTDSLPPGLAVSDPANPSTTCGGIVTALPGSSQVRLSGGSIPAGGNCTFRASVVASQAGTLTNTIGAGAIESQQGLTNELPDSSDLSVFSPPAVSKAFNPVSIDAGEISTLTISLSNDNDEAITLTSDLVDALPGNVLVAGSPNVNGNLPVGAAACDPGAVTAVAGAISISLASGTEIPAGGCAFSVDVTSSVTGGYVNTIAAGQLETSAGSNQGPADATLGVGQRAAPMVRKSFVPSTIDVDGIARLTIELLNPNSDAITLTAAFVDTLPGEVRVADPNGLGGSCDQGSLSAPSGGNLVSLANGAGIPAGGCTIQVDVTSGTAGSYTNLIAAGGLVTDAGSNPNPATAGLVVRAGAEPTVLKAFVPGTINPGGVSRLTITLGNPNPGPATLTADLVDTLPAEVRVADPANLGGTCPGAVTAEPGGATVTYASGSQIPSGNCTIVMDVTSDEAGGPWVNTISAGDLQTDLGDNGAPATANLLVNPAQPPSISKAFNPATVGAGGTSTLTISFGNGNAAPATLTADLVDTLPGTVVVANPPNIRVGGGCTLGSVVAVPGANSVTYQAGGAIPAGGCSIAVTVTSLTAGGPFTNSIAAGALETTIGVNPVGTEAGILFTEPSSICGTVFHDRNGDGVMGPGEDPMGGVQVQLTLATPNGPVVVGTTTTAADGSYCFRNLGPGTYTLTQILPSGWSNVSRTPGTDGGTDLGLNLIGDIVLGVGVNALGYDFGNQRQVAPVAVPTLSEWGLILLALLMLAVAASGGRTGQWRRGW